MNESIALQDLAPILKRLRLSAVMPCLKEQTEDPENNSRPYLDLIYELLTSEVARRTEKALARRLSDAAVRHADACMSQIDFKSPRGLKKAQILTLGNCDWIRAHQNCIITGATGCGKTWIASALTNAACRLGFRARFIRVPRLLKNMMASHQLDRGFERELRELKKIDLLVLDDWGIGQMDALGRSDLLEIIEERYDNGSTLITSVLPVSKWSEYIGDATYADSILDRIVRKAHRIEMSGDSMREQEKYGAVKK